MKLAKKPLIGLALFTVAMVMALWILIQALAPPVVGTERTFTAEFSDVSGLVVGNDVRKLGVRVGKVESIALDGDQAKVRFTVVQDEPVYENTKIAVRYLNLVGQRYLDLFQDGPGDGISPPDVTIPASRTVPSFDITTMFNGLRPVFKTLDPDQLNLFMHNLLAVVEGRGPDMGSMIEQIREVTQFTADRSEVIGLIIQNLGGVAREIEYKSPKLNDLISTVGDAFTVLADKADQTQVSLRLASQSLRPVRLLLEELEGAYYGNYAEVDRLLRKWIPGVNAATDVLGRLPGLIDGLNSTAASAERSQLSCGAGQTVPSPMASVLMAGVPVVICK